MIAHNQSRSFAIAQNICQRARSITDLMFLRTIVLVSSYWLLELPRLGRGARLTHPPPPFSRYDFVHANGLQVKANGYRSLLFLLRCCLLQLHGALQKCAKERGSIFYLPVDHLSNITAYTRALQVSACDHMTSHDVMRSHDIM